ncbi:bifunctional nuclease family protein [Agromyces sp. CFH 90414]|uniref:Bifunctional nuclease family protein n=1 Tax=Agromyces agglutinans TaxID=2662258 RepID=A0A6I2FEL4_9MICO|nr:bifunctional nuclease family protein [Agromyces agglutinans]MRG60343.1 bifunctional nuclease family protein [Agromyces agglutinans]
MVQVRVLGVALDAARQHVVLLKPLLEPGGEGRILPIWIGAQEATSILIAIQGEQAPRPLSHDLLTTLFDVVDARVEQATVTRIDGGTFYAELTIATPTGAQVIDARPSDAIALALRAEAPIVVEDEVLEAAGIAAELLEEHEDARDDDAELDEFKRFLDEVDPEDFQG